jgi:hypothetical protein
MKYDLTEKKAWIAPGIEEASVQNTEALKVVTERETCRFLGGKPLLGGAEPDGGDEPGGPS